MSSGTLLRRACKTRTIARWPPDTTSDEGMSSTLHTPCPPLPRFCLRTRGPPRLKPRRKRFAECASGAVEVGVGAPAQVLRAMKDFFHAHLQDHVGVCTDPDAPGRNVPQHCIERSPVFVLLGNRIDPDKYAIHIQELFSHLVGDLIRIDRGLRGNSDLGEFFEDALEPLYSAVSRYVALRDLHTKATRVSRLPLPSFQRSR